MQVFSRLMPFLVDVPHIVPHAGFLQTDAVSCGCATHSRGVAAAADIQLMQGAGGSMREQQEGLPCFTDMSCVFWLVGWYSHPLLCVHVPVHDCKIACVGVLMVSCEASGCCVLQEAT
jgi:hypothetical protein